MVKALISSKSKKKEHEHRRSPQVQENDILGIASKHGARNIRVFGSVARGEADCKSDLDLLVEFLPGSTLLDQAAMILELECLLGVKVDVISDRGLRERIRERILREAAAL